MCVWLSLIADRAGWHIDQSSALSTGPDNGIIESQNSVYSKKHWMESQERKRGLDMTLPTLAGSDMEHRNLNKHAPQTPGSREVTASAQTDERNRASSNWSQCSTIQKPCIKLKVSSGVMLLAAFACLPKLMESPFVQNQRSSYQCYIVSVFCIRPLSLYSFFADVHLHLSPGSRVACYWVRGTIEVKGLRHRSRASRPGN